MRAERESVRRLEAEVRAAREEQRDRPREGSEALPLPSRRITLDLRADEEEPARMGLLKAARELRGDSGKAGGPVSVPAEVLDRVEPAANVERREEDNAPAMLPGKSPEKSGGETEAAAKGMAARDRKTPLPSSARFSSVTARPR